MRNAAHAVIVLLAISSVGMAAHAQGGIFINGVRVNGLKNHTFQGCRVQFDARGNVHITAKGFKIKAIPQTVAPRTLPPTIRRTAPPPPPPPAPKPPPAPVPRVQPRPQPKKIEPPPRPKFNPALKYFLVSQNTRPGYVQYDVNVYINRRWVRKIRNRDSQVVFEINRYLKPGKNTVHFAASKNLDGKAKISNSAADYIRIIIGTGTQGGGTVNITESLLEFKASASQSASFNEEKILTE